MKLMQAMKLTCHKLN